MSYAIISPCRNEAEYMRRTLDTVVAQTVRPDTWIIVDDGSTDATPEILAEYTREHPWIRVVPKPDRGFRAVGGGVVEAFNAGLAHLDLDAFTYVTKMDLDLELPPRYFEELIRRMEAEPRLGSCSGKPYNRRADGTLVSERRGDEMSVGMTKFYRTSCFREIGGFVPMVMWDAIDAHRSRQLGWISRSWDDPELRFVHLRPMGSSQTSVHVGRRRHGMGQYVMGSDLLYFAATCAFRALEPPYVIGGVNMFLGYLDAWRKGVPQVDDPELRRFVRAYQRRALVVGRRRAVEEIEARTGEIWRRNHAAA
ncbi:glycosyltransferase family A protein [Acuticoccus sp. I52.16.1]|uniref:glycosyltransferase family 2 protein n=1 Tax=Acuticoccus sp. I52.16.1 TaxID=2928472 RepID=UPI001FD62258|nr:glycosyltransferase family A protein [Acuticoccus sp. I52.16.1]UOM36019.1 glycosyltransferase family 2 protein [Acuticoccus sp. I52.16.1]